MEEQNQGNVLHRTIKLALDRGEALSVEEAVRLFEDYRLLLEVGPNVASSPTLQAALLTAVNTGRRCFLGGVQVAGDLDVALRVPWRHCPTLADAIIALQGKLAATIDSTLPRIVFGDVGDAAGGSPFAVRATFAGRAASVIPLEEAHRLPERQEFTPSGVLAGALAGSGAFPFVRRSNV